MKHQTDVITHTDSSQGECTCGWLGDRVVNTYAAQAQGRDHVRNQARAESKTPGGGLELFERRPRRGGKNSDLQERVEKLRAEGVEVTSAPPRPRTLADLIGPGRLEGLLAEQRATAEQIRAQKKDPK